MSNRLTKKYEDQYRAAEELPCGENSWEFKGLLLRVYKDLEEQGRMAILPCRIGDAIYVIPSETNFELNKISHKENNRAYKQPVSSIEWWDNDSYLIKTCGGMCSALSEDLGVTWFLTEPDAEAALERMK